MPSPFPGMNPYLEHPDFWSEVHHWLITLLAETLVPQVRPKYRVAIEKRIYELNESEGDNGNTLLVGIPDVSVHRQSAQQPASTTAVAAETTYQTKALQPTTVTLPMLERIKQSYLEIREIQTGQVVTAVEILSPVNKRPGEGRNTYLQKRQRILSSLTHLVEIDLLRGWQPMPVLGHPTNSDYRVLVSDSAQRPKADWYAIDLRVPLPILTIPLLGESASVDLQRVLNTVSERAGFDYVIDYNRPVEPPLPDEKAIWAKQLLQAEK